MIPGSDILSLALSVIDSATFDYYAYNSRTTNAIGLYVTTFDEPVSMTGSIQAVPRNEYERLGLDFAKNYIRAFAELNWQEAGRDRAGDQIAWNDLRWQIVSITPWFNIDGWSEILAIEVSNA